MSRIDASREVEGRRAGADCEAPAAEAPAAEAADRVVIVGDGSPEALVLEARLEALGHSVSAAPNCSELLARAAGDRPGAVLLDLGSEAAPERVRTARELRERFGAAVVFLVDDASEELFESSSAARPFGYLLRPFSDGQLQLSLRSALAAGSRRAKGGGRRKKLKRQVRRLERRLAILDAVLELVPDALFATDENGVRLTSSASAAPFLTEFEPGGSLVQPLDWRLCDVEANKPLEWDDLPLPRALRGEQIDDLLLSVRHAEGTEVAAFVGISAKPLPLGRSGKTGAVVLVRDVTAERRSREELQSAVAEQEARASLMEAVFESMGEGLIVADERGELLVWNSAAQRLGGAISRRWDSRRSLGRPRSRPGGRYRPGQWGQPFGIFLPDGETPLPKDESPLWRAIRGRATESKRLFIRNAGRPEGGFVSVSAQPLVRAQEERRAGILMIRDLTEEERMSAELEDTVARLQSQTNLMDTVFNSLGAGVVAADVDGNFIAFNPAAEDIVGRDIVQMPPEEWTEHYGIFLPDGTTPAPTDEVPLVRAMRGESLDDAEMVIRHARRPEGVPVNASARPLRSADGGIQGGVVVFTDLGPRKEAERALRRTLDDLRYQTELVEAAFQAISDGVLVADAECNLVYVNAAAAAIVDLETGERIRMDDLKRVVMRDGDKPGVPYGCFDPERHTPLTAGELPIVRAVLGGFAEDRDILIRNRLVPEGAIIRTRGRPLFNADGSRRGGVATIRNVTAERRADEALARAFAEGRLEMMDTILHNVGNAVSSVVVGAETIADSLDRDPLMKRLSALAEAVEARKGDWAEYVENDPQGRKVLPFLVQLAMDLDNRDRFLRSAAGRVRDRAVHISDIVRTQRDLGSVAAGQTDVDVVRAVQATVRLLGERIEDKGIAVDLEGLKASPQVRVYASQFHQMLLNLLTNAIEAIDELATAGGRGAPPEIAVCTRADDDRLVLEVRDSGVGFDEDPRTLVAAGYSTKGDGSGLGLHSTANFVASVGGRIELSSEGRGRGATVRVMLPVTPSPGNEPAMDPLGDATGER